MSNINPPFRADQVGSLLRPKTLLDARERYANNQITKDELREVENQCIREVVAKQEAIGLRSITDGEFRRTYFHIDFLERLAGVTVSGGIEVKFTSKKGTVDFAPRASPSQASSATSKTSNVPTSSSSSQSPLRPPRSPFPRRRWCTFAAGARPLTSKLTPT
jgi:hypothetical protein